MHHQDLKTIVLRKNPVDLQKSYKRDGLTTSVAKNTATQTKKILDDNLDTFKVPKVSHALCRQIQNARMSLGLKQKDLASKINVTPAVIQTYENGKAVPDNKVMQKLRRILKVKLVV